MMIRAALVSAALLASPAFAGQIGSAGTASVKDVTLDNSAADFFQYASQVNPHGNDGAIGFSDAFSKSGTGAWSHIADFETPKKTTGTDIGTVVGSQLLFTFSNANDLKGTWTVKNLDTSSAITLDLVFAMHVGGGSGAWLFDNQTLLAGATVAGAWTQNMLNKGTNVADFSNLTLFARDGKATKTPVPPPVVTPPPPIVTTPPVITPPPVVTPPPVITPPPVVTPPPVITPPPPVDPVDPTPIPEPAPLAMVALGLGLLGLSRRKKK